MAKCSDVVVVGAGMGGLCCAIELAAAGLQVTLCDKQTHLGGKIFHTPIANQSISLGPTVLTMPWVFEQLFQRAGSRFAAMDALKPLPVVARHVWTDHTHFDLSADSVQTYADVASMFGASAASAYRAFCKYSQSIYETVLTPFLQQQKPSFFSLLQAGAKGLQLMRHIDPFRSMHQALRHFFKEPKLQQLFGRYATYCGGSPYQTPATLLLIAHVEQLGVYLLPGGIPHLIETLAQLAISLGVDIQLGTEVTGLRWRGPSVVAAQLGDGRQLATLAVVLGNGPEGLAALQNKTPPTPRTKALSALVMALSTPVLPRSHAHNVYFSDDHESEFTALFTHQQIPKQPSVYSFCPHWDQPGRQPHTFLINAPANGQAVSDPPALLQAALQPFGYRLPAEHLQQAQWRSPQDFAALAPGSFGAVYGAPPHAWWYFFTRAGSKSRWHRNVYFCGGNVHPGPGVPMVALSGQLAAQRLLGDWPLLSTKRWLTMSVGCL